MPMSSVRFTGRKEKQKFSPSEVAPTILNVTLLSSSRSV